jgi:hypothetical protein
VRATTPFQALSAEFWKKASSQPRSTPRWIAVAIIAVADSSA